jgi:hypothetical protein
MWDDQRRDGKNNFRRILEAERTSWPKPWSYWWWWWLTIYVVWEYIVVNTCPAET